MKKFIKILEYVTILFTCFITGDVMICRTLRRIKVKLFPSKAEFNDALFAELNDEIVFRKHLGEFISNELNFLYNVVVFNHQIETLNEIINNIEYYNNNLTYDGNLNYYEAVLEGAKYTITKLVPYKELRETMRTTSEINLSKVHNIYFNKALKYYEEWDKEGFNNIIYKYNKALKEIEIHLKKLKLNSDFTEEK